jgi:hypothetical protein
MYFGSTTYGPARHIHIRLISTLGTLPILHTYSYVVMYGANFKLQFQTVSIPMYNDLEFGGSNCLLAGRRNRSETF